MSRGSATSLRAFQVALEPAVVHHAAAMDNSTGGAELRKILSDVRADERLRMDGLLVLSGLEVLPESDRPRLFATLCATLGDLLPQSMAGREDLVRSVSYRGGDLRQRGIRYSDSRAGGSYHNDGVPMCGRLPDLLALFCVRQAARGGEVVFVESARALGIATQRMPRLPAILGAEFHFDQRRPDDPAASVVRRIVNRVGSGTSLVYLRDYIESGHSVDGVRPLTSEEIRAMDVLDAVLEDESLHIEGRLEPGQMVVGDNLRYLHGRHEFSDEADADRGRLMLRCWMRRSGRE